MYTLRLLFLIGPLLLNQPLSTGLLENEIATTIKGQPMVFQIHHVVHHRIEEVAVVGNRYQNVGVALRLLFQSEDGVQVEMAGRFTE